MSWLWDLLTVDLRNHINILKNEIEVLKELNTQRDNKILYMETELIKKVSELTELKKSLETLENANNDEKYWNDKWSHNSIQYKAQGTLYRDMRSLINYPSYIASEVVLFDGLNKETEDEILFSILKWCDTKIRYTSDTNKYGVVEHWQDSDIALQEREGDCEDKALAFKVLTLVCGIPDYRVKVVAGWVQDPKDRNKVVGHAYTIVLIGNDWYTFDPTYYPDYTPIKDRIKHINNKQYKEIWWAFTKGLCFSQRSVTI